MRSYHADRVRPICLDPGNQYIQKAPTCGGVRLRLGSLGSGSRAFETRVCLAGGVSRVVRAGAPESSDESRPPVWVGRGEIEGEWDLPDLSDSLTPQVLPLSRKKSRRRVVATAGASSFEAEGKGLEPSTGKPAPDFESGC